MAQYLVLDGTKIAAHMSGPLPTDMSNIREVPDQFDTTGEDIREYDLNWKVLPLAQRISAGLVEVPSGWKVDGERFLPMNPAERVKAGIDLRPKGFVLDADTEGNPILRTGTVAEQVANGDMTQATADTINAVNVRAERDALLAGCDWTQAADAPATVNKPAWATYRQALRDLPAQGGFPSGTINWPTPPGGVAI
jgi:hypothetical protein